MPSVVELLAVVGDEELFQTTPFAEIVPPLATIPEPPDEAEDSVILEIAVVVEMDGLPTAVALSVGAEDAR